MGPLVIGPQGNEFWQELDVLVSYLLQTENTQENQLKRNFKVSEIVIHGHLTCFGPVMAQCTMVSGTHGNGGLFTSWHWETERAEGARVPVFPSKLGSI